jgi:hypothetical protein
MSVWSTINFSLALIFLVHAVLPVFGFAPLGNRFRSSQGLLRKSTLSDEPALRIGHGFDIHRLIEGTKLIIGISDSLLDPYNGYKRITN